MKDSKQNGIKFLLNTRVTDIKNKDGKWKITLNHEHEIFSNFIINAAGGESIDIAHSVDMAKNFTDKEEKLNCYRKIRDEIYEYVKNLSPSKLKRQ